MRRAFTLIELLVVIAIIAILAAILFPVFAKAREKARQASCQSNLKQVALAFLMYAQDYDGAFPFWRWGDHRGAINPQGFAALQWYVRLYPYVKNVQIFACPSRSDNGGCRWCYANPDDGRYVSAYPAFRTINYGYNEVITNGRSGQPVKDSDLRYPAETLLVGDCRSSLGGWAPAGVLWRYAQPLAPWGTACAGCGTGVVNPSPDWAVHNGGANIAFTDGHVKWLQWNKVRHGPGCYYWLP